MDMSQDPRKLLYAPDPLGPTRTENLREGIDSRRSDAHVVHRHTGVVGLLDGVCGVRPGITALVTFIGDKTVADDDQQAPFGRLREQPARQMAKWRTESGVSARGKAKPARRDKPAVFEVLQAVHFDSMTGIAREYEDAMALARQCHGTRKRIGTGQFQPEDSSAMHTQRRTAVEKQSRGDVAVAGQ